MEKLEIEYASPSIDKKTTNLEIFQYGFGGMTVNISYAMVTSFLLFFWTNNAMLPAAAAGSILFLGRLAGVITDPIAGIVADSTYTRWGKYRPYLMFVTPLFLVMFFLLFTDYNTGTGGKIAIYAGLYIIYIVLSAIVTVTYESLVPVMSKDLSQRNYVVMSRQLFGIFSSVLVIALANPLVKAFGDDFTAWHLTILLFIAVSILAIIISLKGSKRHDVCEIGDDHGIRKVEFMAQLKLVLSCKPILLLLIPFGLIILANEVTTSSNMYLFKYAIHDVGLFSIVNVASLPAIILASVSVPVLVGKFGKKRVFILACMMSMIRTVVFNFVQPFDNTAVIIGLYAFSVYFLVMAVVTIWTMVPDCVEYILLSKGIQNAGTVTSSFTFMLDLGGAFAGVLVGGILQLAGYAAAEVQPSSIVQTIIGINSLIPLAAFVLAILLVRLYPITNELLAQMKEERV